jgi:hypothetical protein
MAERPVMDPGRIPGPVFIASAEAIKLHWVLANQKAATNVLHAKYTSFPTDVATFVNALFTGVKNAFTTSGLPGSLDVGTSLQAVSIRNLAPITGGYGWAENRSTGTASPGTAVGGTPLPYQVSFVVSLKTGFSGQANRGRVYIPGFNSSAIANDGTCEEEAADNCVQFIQGISDYLDGVGHELSIAQPARQAYEGLTGTAHPAREARLQPVTSITRINLHWDTQRLRQVN